MKIDYSLKKYFLEKPLSFINTRLFDDNINMNYFEVYVRIIRNKN